MYDGFFEEEKIKPRMPEYFRALIKEVRNGAYVNVKTGDVWHHSEAGMTVYIGTLPRKLIPNRRRLHREIKEREGSLEQMMEFN